MRRRGKKVKIKNPARLLKTYQHLAGQVLTLIGTYRRGAIRYGVCYTSKGSRLDINVKNLKEVKGDD